MNLSQGNVAVAARWARTFELHAAGDFSFQHTFDYLALAWVLIAQKR